LRSSSYDVADLVVDDFVAVKHPESDDKFCIVKVNHVDYDFGIFTDQYWISQARVIKNAVYRQE